jgi:hypothetical protein
VAALSITLAFSVDLPPLRALKTEQTFGLWVVFAAPLALGLAAVQIALWWRCPGARPWPKRSGSSPGGST